MPKCAEYKLAAGEFFHGEPRGTDQGGLRQGGGNPAGRRIEVVGPAWDAVSHDSGRRHFSPRGVADSARADRCWYPGKAQQWFADPGAVSTISLVLEAGADEASVREDVASHLPQGLTVRPTEARARLGRDAFRNAEQGLQFASR